MSGIRPELVGDIGVVNDVAMHDDVTGDDDMLSTLLWLFLPH